MCSLAELRRVRTVSTFSRVVARMLLSDYLRGRFESSGSRLLGPAPVVCVSLLLAILTLSLTPGLPSATC